MLRAALICTGVALTVGALDPQLAAAAAQFWLSASGDASAGSSGSAPPANAAAILNVVQSAPATTGSLYLWGRPEPNKTLKNWSIRVVATRPDVLSLTTSDVGLSFNPDLDPATPDVRRWQGVKQPAGQPKLVDAVNATVIEDLEGFSVLGNPIGVGIGKEGGGNGTTVGKYLDPNYHAISGSWLLAKINYSLTAVRGKSEIYLQIGDLGMNHLEDEGKPLPNSSYTNVVFGALTDPELNAGISLQDGSAKRHKSSATPEAIIEFVKPNFDADTDVDGVDFLAWQRGFAATGGASLAQGDANGDGAVDAVDLSHWRSNFGAAGLTPGIAAVPEPQAWLLLLATLFEIEITRIAHRRHVREGNPR